MAAEKNFENRLKRWFESIGVYALGTPDDKMKVAPVGYYEKRWGGGTFTKAGLPDIHAVINGKSYDLELKAENGKASELQKFTIRQIQKSGSFAMILRPSDFEDFKKLIERELKNGC